MKKILLVLSIIVLFVACDDKVSGTDMVREETFNKIAFDNSRIVTFEGLKFAIPTGMEGKEDRLDREYEIIVNREEREKERKRERQKDRKTKTEREKDRKTEIQKDR